MKRLVIIRPAAESDLLELRRLRRGVLVRLPLANVFLILAQLSKLSPDLAR